MSKSNIIIRDFANDDYPAVADIRNAVDPDWGETAESLADKDKKRDTKLNYHRWVAAFNGKIAGTGIYNQSEDPKRSQTYMVYVQIHPDYQKNGIGTALANHIMQNIQLLDPEILQSYSNEEWAAGVHMLESRGFIEYWRMSESHLDVDAFDLSQHSDFEEKLRKQNIMIKTFRQLEKDPDRNRKLYDLEWEIEKDIPDAHEAVRSDFDTFVRDRLESPESLPDGYLVAVHDDEYVGMCDLTSSSTNDNLHNQVTGVKREFRRKGIAMAMKVKAIAYAKQRKCPKLITLNDDANPPILAVNKYLNYKIQPALIMYEKKILKNI